MTAASASRSVLTNSMPPSASTSWPPAVFLRHLRRNVSSTCNQTERPTVSTGAAPWTRARVLLPWSAPDRHCPLAYNLNAVDFADRHAVPPVLAGSGVKGSPMSCGLSPGATSARLQGYETRPRPIGQGSMSPSLPNSRMPYTTHSSDECGAQAQQHPPRLARRRSSPPRCPLQGGPCRPMCAMSVLQHYGIREPTLWNASGLSS
jgi:hypothetical protein